MVRCPACRSDLDTKATVCAVCGYNFVAEREKRAAVMAMIPLAEGKPAVHVDGRNRSRPAGCRASSSHGYIHKGSTRNEQPPRAVAGDLARSPVPGR
jgi:hypothetical protein